MKNYKISVILLLICFGGCLKNMAADDFNVKDDVEIWDMSNTNKIKEILPKNDRPQKDSIIIQYFPKKNNGIIHFIYSNKKIEISIIKKEELVYSITYKENNLIMLAFDDVKYKRKYFYLFHDEKDKKEYNKRKKYGNYDGVFRKNSTETIDELLERMREEAKFAEEEQKAFEKDPPNMMKGGK